eukprot:CAMPEP_0173405198 /NCGR_PEP_ID=MMETSP1356-20130122/61248_1 /TAXON_ID=77927 ORGANISM="Hemiselmis virescens, Strain PCC157" /NCGR_SAMPLE_ID=MMETSP1356 /ASSEMBLY_ACC=CAM_ASM_000847 /LENGTH=93 /DNA_ID=CAMNT_0014365979 /DNA_START=18 /DNA_END=295 /DNA_ORIENTATION=+
MDELDRFDFERGWENTKHAFMTITGQEPPGHNGNGWSLIPGQATPVHHHEEEQAVPEAPEEPVEQDDGEEAAERERERKRRLLRSAPESARQR